MIFRSVFRSAMLVLVVICAVYVAVACSKDHLMPSAVVKTLNTTNETLSEFPGEYSGRRLAYYRWRTWLLERAAVLQQVPPVPKAASINDTNLLFVDVRMTPVTIIDVDEARQTVRMTTKIEFWWKDPALALDDALLDYFTDGNYSVLPRSVTLPCQALWLPSIIVMQGVSTLKVLEDVDEAQVSRDGTIVLNVPYVMTFTCKFDMTGYPFDEHDCGVTLFDSSNTVHVRPSSQPWDVTAARMFGVAGEWDLRDVITKTHTMPDGQIFPEFVLHIRRKTTFYSVMIVSPLVLTSYLNVLVFLLPPDLGDKASYLVTVTISVSVFASFFNEDMPRGLDSMPRVFSLYIFVLAESYITLLMCLFVLKRYKHEVALKEEGLDDFSPSFSPLSISMTDSQSSTRPMVSKKGPDGMDSEIPMPMPAKRRRTFVTARRLDMIFFVVILIANTVGIAAILADLIK